MRRFLFISCLGGMVISCSLPALAASIYEQPYGYGYGDTVTAMNDDAFLVCGDCRPDKLKKLPLQQVVGIKMNPIEEPIEAPEPRMQEAAAMPTSSSKVQPSFLGTVKFEFDSERLRQSEKEKLKKIVASVPSGRTLTITGYTCTIGTKDYNKKLSTRRAQNVAEYLSAHGIRITHVEGKGACCAVSTDKKLNRRVEIFEKESK